MLETIWNAPLLRDLRNRWLRHRLARCLRDEAAEEFLQVLLSLMAVAMLVDPAYRRHVQGLEARYGFRTQDGAVELGATISGGRMKVRERAAANPHATLVFRDSRAIMRSLLSAEPDLLGSILRQDVTFDGNLNHVYRFAYLARRLQLSVTGRV